jgi:TP901 family phage tail tape measure protein
VIQSTLRYDADLSSAMAQVKALTGQIATLNAAFVSLDRTAQKTRSDLASAFTANVSSMGGYTSKMVEMTSATDNFGKALQRNKLTMSQYFAEAYRGMTRQDSMMRQYARQQAKYMESITVPMGTGPNGRSMAAVFTPSDIDMRNMTTKMNVMNQQFNTFRHLVNQGSQEMINFGKNTQWTGRQLTVGLTMPVLLFSSTFAKAFMDIDKELTRFAKVYGEDLVSNNQRATDAMKAQVVDLAKTISSQFGVAAKETAALAADVAATGKTGQDLLDTVSQTTRLAVLGEVDRQEAMKATLAIQSAFKQNTDELAESINFLNAIENQTSTTLNDLVEAIPKAGPVIKGLGGSIKDLSVLMVAMKEGGIPAAEAANAIKSGMASMINPTKKASETAKQFGVDLVGIVNANKGQLMPTLFALQGALSGLSDFAKSRVIEEIFGKYQFARITALFNNLGRAGSQTQQAMQLVGASTVELAAIANRELKAYTESTTVRFQRMMETVKNQLLPVGQALLEGLIPVLEKVSGAIDTIGSIFKSLPDPVKNFGKILGGLALVAGPVLMLVGLFKQLIGNGLKAAMSIVTLGARLGGIKVGPLEHLDAQMVAANSQTKLLTQSFISQQQAVNGLNKEMAIYLSALRRASTINPSQFGPPVSGRPPTGRPPVRRAGGGKITGPGGPTDDRIPALLSDGEYVVRASAVDHYGEDFLDKLNAKRFSRGGILRFPSGGVVGRQSAVRGHHAADASSAMRILSEGAKPIGTGSEGTGFYTGTNLSSLVDAYSDPTMSRSADAATRLARMTRGDFFITGRAKKPKIYEMSMEERLALDARGPMSESEYEKLSKRLMGEGYTAIKIPFRSSTTGGKESNMVKYITEDSFEPTHVTYVGPNGKIKRVKINAEELKGKSPEDIMRILEIPDKSIVESYLKKHGSLSGAPEWMSPVIQRHEAAQKAQQERADAQAAAYRAANPAPVWNDDGPDFLSVGGMLRSQKPGPKIPAFVSNGEYLINSDAVKHYGVGTIDQINSMEFDPKKAIRANEGTVISSRFGEDFDQRLASSSKKYSAPELVTESLVSPQMREQMNLSVRRLIDEYNERARIAGRPTIDLSDSQIKSMSQLDLAHIEEELQNGRKVWRRGNLMLSSHLENNGWNFFINSGPRSAPNQNVINEIEKIARANGMKSVFDQMVRGPKGARTLIQPSGEDQTRLARLAVSSVGNDPTFFRQSSSKARNWFPLLVAAYDDRLSQQSLLGGPTLPMAGEFAARAASEVRSGRQFPVLVGPRGARLRSDGGDIGAIVHPNETVVPLKVIAEDGAHIDKNGNITPLKMTSGGIESGDRSGAILSSERNIQKYTKMREKHLANMTRLDVEMAALHQAQRDLGKQENLTSQQRLIKNKEYADQIARLRDERASEDKKAARVQQSITNSERNISRAKEIQARREQSIASVTTSRFANMSADERRAEAARRRAQAGFPAERPGQARGRATDPNAMNSAFMRSQMLGGGMFGLSMAMSSIAMFGDQTSAATQNLMKFSNALMVAGAALQIAPMLKGAGSNFMGMRSLAGRVGTGAAAQYGAAAPGAAAMGFRQTGIMTAARGGASMGTMAALGGRAALGVLGGPVGIGIAIASIIGTVGWQKYQENLENARKTAISAFNDPAKSAEYFGIQIEDVAKKIEAANMAGLAKDLDGVDQALRDAVKTDYEFLINKLKESSTTTGAQDLATAFNNMIMSGLTAEQAKAAVEAISVEAGEKGGLAYAEAIRKNLVNVNITREQAIERGTKAFLPNSKLLPDLQAEKSQKEQQIADIEKRLNDLRQQSGRVSETGLPLRNYQVEAQAAGMIDSHYWTKIVGEAGDATNKLNDEINMLNDEIEKASKVNVAAFTQVSESLLMAYAESPKEAMAEMKKMQDAVAKMGEGDQGLLMSNVASWQNQFNPSQWASVSNSIKDAQDSAAAMALTMGGIPLSEAVVEGKKFSEVANEILAAKNAVDVLNQELRQLQESFKTAVGADLEKDLQRGQDRYDRLNSALEGVMKRREKNRESMEEEFQTEQEGIQDSIEGMQDQIEVINEVTDSRREQAEEIIDGLEEEQDQINEVTDKYLKSIEKRAKADNFFTNQRKSNMSALGKLAAGDVFGFLVDREAMQGESTQYAYDKEIESIQENRDAQVEAIDDAIEAKNKEVEEFEKAQKRKTDAIQKEIEAQQDLLEENEKAHERRMEIFDTETERRVTTLQTQLNAQSRANGRVQTMIDEINNGQLLSEEELNNDLGPVLARRYVEEEKAILRKMYLAKAAEIAAANPTFTNDQVTRAAITAITPFYNQVVPSSGYFAGQPGARDTGQDTILSDIGAAEYARAQGGYISGPGGPTDDKIPAYLSNGEYVIRASSVNKYGKKFFDRLNAKNFADGGLVMFGDSIMRDVDPKLSDTFNGKNVVKTYQGGITPSEAISRWGDALSSGPSNILISLGTNGPGPYPTGNYEPDFSRSKFSSQIDRISSLAGSGKKIYWLTNLWHKARPYNSLILSKANEKANMEAIDFASRIESKTDLHVDDNNRKTSWSNHGKHPSSGAYAVMADMIKSRISGFGQSAPSQNNDSSNNSQSTSSNTTTTTSVQYGNRIRNAFEDYRNGRKIMGGALASFIGQPMLGKIVRTTQTPPSTDGPPSSPTPNQPSNDELSEAQTKANAIVALARRHQNIPYGFEIPDLDEVPSRWGCATSLAWIYHNAAGIRLPSMSMSNDQYHGLERSVSANNMKPGDLIFYYNKNGVNRQNKVNHVEMYLGNGDVFNGGKGIRDGLANYPVVGIKRALKYATGGHITGPGGPKDDKIPAWLSNGEYVIKADSVSKYGKAMMDSINAGMFGMGGMAKKFNMPKYAIGGPVGKVPNVSGMSGSDMSITIHANGISDPEVFAKKVVNLIDRKKSQREHARMVRS